MNAGKSTGARSSGVLDPEEEGCVVGKAKFSRGENELFSSTGTHSRTKWLVVCRKLDLVVLLALPMDAAIRFRFISSIHFETNWPQDLAGEETE